MNSIWTSRGVRHSKEVCPNVCRFICQACTRVYRCPLLHGTGTAPRCASGHFMGKQELCQSPAEGQGSCGFSLGDVPAKLGVHVLSTPRDSMGRSEIQRSSMRTSTKLRMFWTVFISSCSWKRRLGIWILFVVFWKICYLLPCVYRTLLKPIESWCLEMSGGILSSNRQLE